MDCTECATESGIAIEGNVRVRRARAPRVEDAEKMSEATWMRVSVEIRSGREGGESGRPRSASSWLEKVCIAG